VPHLSNTNLHELRLDQDTKAISKLLYDYEMLIVSGGPAVSDLTSASHLQKIIDERIELSLKHLDGVFANTKSSSNDQALHNVPLTALEWTALFIRVISDDLKNKLAQRGILDHLLNRHRENLSKELDDYAWEKFGKTS
jgi:hypothetical protein